MAVNYYRGPKIFVTYEDRNRERWPLEVVAIHEDEYTRSTHILVTNGPTGIYNYMKKPTPPTGYPRRREVTGGTL